MCHLFDSLWYEPTVWFVCKVLLIGFSHQQCHLIVENWRQEQRAILHKETRLVKVGSDKLTNALSGVSDILSTWVLNPQFRPSRTTQASRFSTADRGCWRSHAPITHISSCRGCQRLRGSSLHKYKATYTQTKHANKNTRVSHGSK